MWYPYRSQQFEVLLHSKVAKHETEEMVRIIQRLWLWFNYHPDKANIVGDALSRKMLSMIEEALAKDRMNHYTNCGKKLCKRRIETSPKKKMGLLYFKNESVS